MITEWIFPITAGVLIIVEIFLIMAVRDLTRSIKQLNVSTQEKFNILVDEISRKFKGLVDLAILMKKEGGANCQSLQKKLRSNLEEKKKISEIL
jgi:hypothetical protein